MLQNRHSNVGEGVIHSINYHRLILDEAHSIKVLFAFHQLLTALEFTKFG